MLVCPAGFSQMIQQYTQMARQLAVLYDQVTLLQQQVQSLTGHYGHGSIGNPANGWGITSWANIADMVSRGLNPGDAAQVRAYQEARNRYQNQFPALSSGLQTSNPRMNAYYSRVYSDGIAGMSLGESTFNQTNNDLQDIQALKDRIDQTDNLKSAMDLNAAISVRVAAINAEMLRTQSAQLRLQAGGRNDDANAYAAQAEFFAQ